MHRAKHRTDGDAAVLATTLIERFAVAPAARPAGSGSRHGVATLPAPAEAPGGSGLFGSAPTTGPTLAVPADEAPREAAPLFGGPADTDGGSPFGASRHARPRTGPALPAIPTPRLPSLTSVSFPSLPAVRVRPQPVGAAISVTVLGAAAAVTAVATPVAPPTAIETTGSMAPVQRAVPAPVPPVGPTLPVQAQAALPDQPTVQIDNLVGAVKAEMQKSDAVVAKPFTTVANKTAMSSPAAMRKAALTNALGKLGKPYRWGAVGPNSFDCSGLVKYAFDRVGRKLPRTSRAQAGVGTPVKRSQLQPGDLVFFYQPISHVGIYIGNNKIVHASQSGQPVKVSDMSRMRFTTARRI